MREKEKTVLAMPAGDTYDIVIKHSIHAYPSSYPKARDYFIPIRKKGVMEYLYRVINTIDCYIDDIEGYRSVLTKEQFINLKNYHKDRLNGFNYGSPHEKYRFCILKKCGDIVQPFIKKGVRKCVGLHLEDIPLLQETNTIYKASKQAEVSEVNVFIEYQGESFSVDEIMDKTKQASGKQAFEELIVYYQPENDIVYYLADGDEGDFSFSNTSILPKQDKQMVNPEEDANMHSIPEEQMTIREKVINAVNYYVDKNGYDTWMSRKEFCDFINSFYPGQQPINYSSLLPADYCYNRYNFGLTDFEHKDRLLEYDNGKLRLLGENYPYTGDVWHFPQNPEMKPYIVGHWSNGIFELYSDQEGITHNRIIMIDKNAIDESEREERNSQALLYESAIEESDNNFEYVAKPETRKIPEIRSDKGVRLYPRDQQKKVNALMRSGFKCEFDESHESFISRKTGKRYLEPHHLIPLEYWESFKKDIDVEANIVCLCSNCHNEVHYGANAERIIKCLYMKRKDELQSAEIGISFENLMKMYDGTFIDTED